MKDESLRLGLGMELIGGEGKERERQRGEMGVTISGSMGRRSKAVDWDWGALREDGESRSAIGLTVKVNGTTLVDINFIDHVS